MSCSFEAYFTDDTLCFDTTNFITHQFPLALFYWNPDTKVINHSADIAPGSSGGPLFDKNGYLIGLNTFGDDKFNFAVSADHIKELLNK